MKIGVWIWIVCFLSLACAPAISDKPLSGVPAGDSPGKPTGSHRREPRAATPNKQDESSSSSPQRLATKDDTGQASERSPVSQAGTQAKGAEPRFKRREFKPGDKTNTEISASVTIEFSAGARSGEGSFEYQRAHTSRVLAAENGKPTKLEVSYTTHRTEKRGFEQKQEVSPVEGHSYVVELRKGSLRFRTAQGRSVSAEEEAELERDFRYLKKQHPDFDLRALGAADFGPGREIAMPQALLQQVLGEKTTFIQGAWMVYRGVEDVDNVRCAGFGLRISLEGEYQGLKLSSELKGAVDIAVDGAYPAKLELSGPLDMQPVSQERDARGTGTVTLSVKYGVEFSD